MAVVLGQGLAHSSPPLPRSDVTSPWGRGGPPPCDVTIPEGAPGVTCTSPDQVWSTHPPPHDVAIGQGGPRCLAVVLGQGLAHSSPPLPRSDVTSPWGRGGPPRHLMNQAVTVLDQGLVHPFSSIRWLESPLPSRVVWSHHPPAVGLGKWR